MTLEDYLPRTESEALKWQCQSWYSLALDVLEDPDQARLFFIVRMLGQSRISENGFVKLPSKIWLNIAQLEDYSFWETVDALIRRRLIRRRGGVRRLSLAANVSTFDRLLDKLLAS